MKKKLLLAVSILLVLMLALCACGGLKDAKLSFESATFTYDGQPKTIAVEGLPEGATVKYSVNGGEEVDAVSVVNGGVYTVVAKITLPEKYEAHADMVATLTINNTGTRLSLDGASFVGGTFAYDGEAHFPTLVGTLPAGIGYTFTKGTGVVNAGESSTFDVTFSINDPDMAANYLPPAPITGLVVSVEKAVIDMSKVSFKDAVIPFDGNYHELAITGDLHEALKVEYSLGAVKKGEHPMTATFSFKNPADAANYEIPADKKTMTATLTIGPGDFALGEQLFVDRTVYYNGIDQTPKFTGLPEGLVAHVETFVMFGDIPVAFDEIVDPGTYRVEVSFSFADGYSEADYTLPAPRAFTFVIDKKPLDGLALPSWNMGNGWITVGEDGYFLANGSPFTIGIVGLPEANEDYVVTATISGDNGQSAAGIYTVSVVFAIESDYYVLPEGYELPDLTYQIADKQIDESKITLGDSTVEYDGAAHKIELGYVDDATAAALGIKEVIVKIYDAKGNDITEAGVEGFTNAGTYRYVFTFIADEENGYAPMQKEVTLTIEKKVISLDGLDIVWVADGDQTKVLSATSYLLSDGKKHTVALSDATVALLAENAFQVKKYSKASATKPGEYVVTAVLVCDDNHEIAAGSETITLPWAIAMDTEDVWSPEIEK